MIHLGLANDAIHYHLPGGTRDPIKHPVRHLPLPSGAELTETDVQVIHESLLGDIPGCDEQSVADDLVRLLNWCLRTREQLLQRSVQLSSLNIQAAIDHPASIHASGTFQDPEWMFSHAPFSMEVIQAPAGAIVVTVVDEQGFSDILGNWRQLVQDVGPDEIGDLDMVLREERLSELRPLSHDLTDTLNTARRLAGRIEQQDAS